MKIKKSLLVLGVLVATLLLVFSACSKDDKKEKDDNLILRNWKATVPNGVVEHNSKKGVKSIEAVLLEKASYHKASEITFVAKNAFTFKMGTTEKKGEYAHTGDKLVLKITQEPKETLSYSKVKLTVTDLSMTLDRKEEFTALAKTDEFWTAVIKRDEKTPVADRLTEKPKDFEVKKFDLNYAYKAQKKTK